LATNGHSSESLQPARSDELILHAFARIDGVAFGIAVGAVLGLLIFAATTFVVVKGSEAHDLKLELLSQYYPGYTVTLTGAIVGFVYGLLSGFLLGWFIALLRNASLRLYLRLIRKKSELSRLNDFLDRV
jgi:flagellar biosynthesis component FlhA